MVCVRTRFRFPSPKVGGLKSKKAQNNEFVESGLEKLGFNGSNKY